MCDKMHFEVILRMNSSSALVTVAMLSTFLSERHSEYLDLLSPFVLSLLPLQTGAEVIKSDVIVGLKEKYGFEDFPIQVLNKVLIKNSKSKAGYLARRQDTFIVAKPFDRERFEASQRKIRDAHTKVIEKLQTYFKDHTHHKSITEENAREYFIYFLENSGLALINGLRDLKLIAPKRDYNLFHVAQFVLNECENRTEVFDNIVELVRGFFVYKSIYFFSTDQKAALKSRLNGTRFYLDTRFLIEVLGYHTAEAKKAAWELIDLVRSSGGEIATYLHLKDELAGVLTKYARDIPSRPYMRLEYLDVNQYDEVNTIRLRDSLEEVLKKHGIALVAANPITSLDSDDLLVWGIDDLTQALEDSHGRQSQSDRIKNDVLSVISVCEARRGYNCYNIENCRAILVTSNHSFAQKADQLYVKSSKSEVSPVISDIDITALLWLRSWDKKSSVPREILLENAYAACQPTTELMEAFSRSVDLLKKEERITDEEALILRTQPAPRKDLLRLAQNDASTVTDNMVLKIKDNYTNSLVEQKQRTIDEMASRLADYDRKKDAALDKARSEALSESEAQGKALKIVYITIATIVLLVGLVAYLITSFPWGKNAIWQIIIMALSAIGLFDLLKSRQGWIKRHLTRFQSQRYAKLYDKKLEDVNKHYN